MRALLPMFVGAGLVWYALTLVAKGLHPIILLLIGLYLFLRGAGRLADMEPPRQLAAASQGMVGIAVVMLAIAAASLQDGNAETALVGIGIALMCLCFRLMLVRQSAKGGA